MAADLQDCRALIARSMPRLTLITSGQAGDLCCARLGNNPTTSVLAKKALDSLVAEGKLGTFTVETQLFPLAIPTLPYERAAPGDLISSLRAGLPQDHPFRYRNKPESVRLYFEAQCVPDRSRVGEPPSLGRMLYEGTAGRLEATKPVREAIAVYLRYSALFVSFAGNDPGAFESWRMERPRYYVQDPYVGINRGGWPVVLLAGREHLGHDVEPHPFSNELYDELNRRSRTHFEVW